MDEMKKLPFETKNPPPVQPEETAFPLGKGEFRMAAGVLILSILLCDFVFYGGFHLGFALVSMGLTVCSAWYLLRAGKKPDWYTGTILVCCLVISAGFARSDDGFVKFVMVCFLLFGIHLALTLLAGQNRRDAASVASALDAPRALFVLGIGKLPESFRGAKEAYRSSGEAAKKSTSAVLGLIIALPLVILVASLLISADAAFEGLMNLLPELEFSEPLFAVSFGLCVAVVLYTRNAALNNLPRPEADTKKLNRHLSAITVNIVLGAVCVVYGAYLLSQLAYLSGGLAGILPEGFTMAEYARRGFFEMAWLCFINLSTICGAVWLVEKQDTAPGITRALCMVLGAVTLFLVVTASAKMFMYIGGYGLTRLRILTEVIMIFLGLTTALVCAWLVKPSIPYMKLVVVSALVIGALVFWVDVDTMVAAYNVSAYQSGALESVDVFYLYTLSDGAIPYIARLVEDADPKVAEQAANLLERMTARRWNDFRDLNWATYVAEQVIRSFRGL